MKLAVLNNSALQETHINRLKQLGDVSLYESIIGELDAISKLKNCEIAVIDSIDVPITEGFLKALPHLKFICLNSTGFEQVDLKAADHHGVIVSNIPDYSTHSVAEHCIALMLSIVRKIPQSYFDVLRSPFEIDLSNKEHNKYLGENLHNKTLGIIGMGRIGSQLAYIAKAFGMNVIPYTRQDDPIALEQLYLKSDFISINSSYSLQPSVLIDERVIPKLKPNCVIINTSRGEFVNESDIAKALKEMRLGGYATDVLGDKSMNNPLLHIDNVIITPHLGFFTTDSLANLADLILKNVESYLDNKPINIVNNYEAI